MPSPNQREVGISPKVDTGTPKEKEKGKGKGKGQEQGGKGDGKSGKGKGKGPVGGCWICAGSHYASNCPQGKSKGKGKARPAYGLVEEEVEWETWSEGPEVRSLSGLQTVERKAPQ